MVSLSQNKQTIYYADLSGYVDVIDADGYKTGEKVKAYTIPKPFDIYVAPAKGETMLTAFGIEDNYTNVMSTCDRSCPITEDSVLWIARNPFDQNGDIVPYNYVVIKVAVGLNSILYAIRKVDVS